MFCITKAIILFDPWEDWSYIIGEEYEILKSHSGSVSLHKINGLGYILDSCIVAFSHNDSYVLMKRLNVSEWEDGITFDEYYQLNEDKIEFFVFCLDNEVLYGPFLTEGDFSEKCSDLNVGETSEWFDTDSKPKGAYGSSIYDVWKYEKYLKKLSKNLP